MVIGDYPIEKQAEDRLGRAPFARQLAATISELNPERGVVMGLFEAPGPGQRRVDDEVRSIAPDRLSVRRELLGWPVPYPALDDLMLSAAQELLHRRELYLAY